MRSVLAEHTTVVRVEQKSVDCKLKADARTTVQDCIFESSNVRDVFGTRLYIYSYNSFSAKRGLSQQLSLWAPHPTENY